MWMRMLPLNAKGEPRLLLGGHLLLQALRIPLICQHLLLLKCLLGEAYLNLYDGAFIDDAGSRLTLINEELMACNLDGLTFLKVAHVSTEEVRLQDLVPNQLDRIVHLAIGGHKSFLSWPYRRHSHYPHTLWHA